MIGTAECPTEPFKHSCTLHLSTLNSVPSSSFYVCFLYDKLLLMIIFAFNKVLTWIILQLFELCKITVVMKIIIIFYT